MAIPTRRNHRLTVGNHIGDAIPDCCGKEMTVTGHRAYVCDCGTVLTVDKHGLVAEIRG